MISKVRAKRILSKIATSGLYVGSGVEDIIDSKLKTTLNRFGRYSVNYKNANPRVLKVTQNSGFAKDESEVARAIFSKIPKVRHDKVLGYYIGLYVGHVIAGTFRRGGSSGGAVSWVAAKLLQSGRIDGFIHVRESGKDGILFEYEISRTVEDIRSGAKSRYYPVELSSVLKKVKQEPGKYAVVGIPEIIMELRLLAQNDEIINDRIRYYFGLVAGHQKTTKYAEAIAWEYGITPGNLERIDFRVKNKKNSSKDYDMRFTGMVGSKRRTFLVHNKESFVSEWAHGFFKARFSDFSDNTFNEVADIVFGDAWLDEYVGDPMGNNIIIARNKELNELLRSGRKSGELNLEPVQSDTIIRSQKGLVHHTQDELPYRLYKHIRAHGWAPPKRTKPSNLLDARRKHVQDIRQRISEKSHAYYRRAVKKGDFEYFIRKMLPHVNAYEAAYKRPITRVRKITNVDGIILTLPGYHNYGNVLQRYALQKFLQNNGFNFVSCVQEDRGNRASYPIPTAVYLKTPLRAIKRLLRNQKPFWYVTPVSEIYKDKSDIKYVQKNVNLIEFVNKYVDIRNFSPNDRYRVYIVGSDQVWRDWRNDRSRLGHFFLDFLRGQKVKRIAYAASFGKDDISEVMSAEDVEYVRPHIEQFDDISVRESSGERLIKAVWGLDAQTVLDPTLLLDRSEYSDLIEAACIESEKINSVFAYILDETGAVAAFIENAERAMGDRATKILAHSGSVGVLPKVESWLKGFRDSKLVITNSFHGMVFSVINNTDFIILGRDVGGLSRITDFLEAYNIADRFVSEDSLEEFDINSLRPIDWDAVNRKLHEDRSKSAEWLMDALNRRKDDE